MYAKHLLLFSCVYHTIMPDLLLLFQTTYNSTIPVVPWMCKALIRCQNIWGSDSNPNCWTWVREFDQPFVVTVQGVYRGMTEREVKVLAIPLSWGSSSCIWGIILTLLHSEMPKLYTFLAFLTAMGLILFWLLDLPIIIWTSSFLVLGVSTAFSSDATFCGVWPGSAMSEHVPKMGSQF